MSNVFLVYLNLCGIIQQLSYPNTLQHNGFFERKHWHIAETGLTMVFHANLLLWYWIDYFLNFVYQVNCLPSSAIGMETPYYKLFGHHLDYCGIRILNCRCCLYLRCDAQPLYQLLTLFVHRYYLIFSHRISHFYSMRFLSRLSKRSLILRLLSLKHA